MVAGDLVVTHQVRQRHRVHLWLSYGRMFDGTQSSSNCVARGLLAN